MSALTCVIASDGEVDDADAQNIEKKMQMRKISKKSAAYARSEART